MPEPYDYLILTAAVTRPDLHRQVFPGYLELIGSARVKWLIHVDDVGTGYSVADTRGALERQLEAPNVNLEFVPATGPGCFLEAAARLMRRAATMLDACRVGIVWLEDDWQRSPRGIAPDLLTALRLRLSRNRLGEPLLRCPGTLARKQSALEGHGHAGGNPLWYVSLVPRSRVSFNPGIWSKPLFERAMAPLAQLPAGELDDPETLCADPWNAPEAYRQLDVFVDPWFQDAGRHWSAERGLVKWDKEPASLQQRGLVSYRSRSRPVRLSRSEAEQRAGWLTLGPGGWHGLGWLVARLAPGGAGMTARLVGLRRPLAELRMIEDGRAELYLHRLHGWARTYPLKKVDGRLSWVGESEVRLESPRLSVSGTLSRHPPWRAIWMIPVQAAAGGVLYVVALLAALRRLDAE